MNRITLLTPLFLFVFSYTSLKSQEIDRDDCVRSKCFYEPIIDSIIRDSSVHAFIQKYDTLDHSFVVCDTLIGNLRAYQFFSEMTDFIYKNEDHRSYEQIYDSVVSIEGERSRKEELVVDSCLTDILTFDDSSDSYHAIYLSPKFGQFLYATVYFFKSDTQIPGATTEEWFLSSIGFLFFFNGKDIVSYASTGIMAH